ncbi:MAG: MFS transporter [Propionibacteriales bacterium]|nr:MFS transporter [Propionibacteriales bacterium]
MTKMNGWAGVWLLALGALIVGTDAHSVAGLLPSMATSLGISVSVAGQSVTVFAIAYAVLSPSLTMVLSRYGHRQVLALALVVFAVGNAASALAPTVSLLLAARVVAAAGAGLFTPMAASVALGLVDPERRGTALAIVTTGVSSALVIGAPAGAAIAAVSSWRVTLGVIAVLGLVSLAALAALPAGAKPPVRPARGQFSILRSAQVRVTLGITLVAFAGVFIPYTYLSRAYEPLIAVIPGGIGTALLLFGLASVAGSLSSGPIADRVPPRWMVVAVTGVLALVDAVTFLGRSSPVLLAVTLLLAGYLSWSILAPQQRQLVDVAPDHSALLVSLNASAGYLGISLSGVVGGAALDVGEGSSFVLMASGFLIMAAAWRALPLRGADDSATPGTRHPMPDGQ